ncbi:uncharacterized protein LOC125029721 isoform X1 [Penaeus chinensis]|uniref:uncharacterized protein LOC125029721 isoform X1 n=2 Tax=Penaeus chinensis TaxID=139456 RepID=UPI001FB8533D|nr:uncharacterized protein LOC125029721 isoform X1 [Penaeus chinensis]XP_047475760.1 uncharacterized protein LOC125029721 isoform X1 [Penaeus chinensis]
MLSAPLGVRTSVSLETTLGKKYISTKLRTVPDNMKLVMFVIATFGYFVDVKGIPIYGLHTESPPQLGMTWLQKDLDIQEASEHITVCLHLRLHFIYTDPALVLYIDGTFFGVVYEGKFALFNARYFWSSETHPSIRAWSHLCYVFGGDPGVAVGGRYVPGRRQGDLGDPPPIVAPRNLTLGMPLGASDPLSSSPVGGFFTVPRVYTRKLTEDEIRTLAECGEGPDDDLGAGSWQVRWSRWDGPESTRTVDFSNVPDTLLTPLNYEAYEFHNLTPSALFGNIPAEAICSPQPNSKYMLVRADRIAYPPAERLCSVYGGRLPETFDEPMVTHMKQVMITLPDLMLFTWIKSNGNKTCRSLGIQARKDVALDMSIGCGHTSQQLLCQVPWSSYVELRHSGPAGYNDRFFLLTRGTKPIFLSQDGRQIVSDGTSGIELKLLDSAGEVLATARTARRFHPMGRHAWRDAATNATRTMVLSACGQTEFTCDDGWCVPLSTRCDGANDCGDDSDEACSVLLPLPPTYRADRPPLPRTPLSLLVRLVRVHDVDVANNLLTAWLQLETRWRDERVLLSQLSNEVMDNILPQPDKVWSPMYDLDNAVFQDKVAYRRRENIFVTTSAIKITEGKIDCIRGYEGYVYNASVEAELQRREDFMASYICNFDLSLFPFDVHECHVNISVMNRGSFYASFDPQDIKIISSASSLTLFEASELRYRYGDTTENITAISLRILLRRQYGAYLFTTFLPCWILGVIGFGTLYFKRQDFSDRIGVTLSCLIVIAALFSQITFTIPQSSSPKVIDVYFFYFIVRLFITFAHHGIFAFLRGAKVRKIADREDSGAEDPPRVTRNHPHVGEDFEKEKFDVLASDGEPHLQRSPIATKMTRKKTWRKCSCCLRMPSCVTHRVWSSEMPSCAQAFNVAGIVWCIAIDLACMTLLFCWIYSARQGAARSFEENRL